MSKKNGKKLVLKCGVSFDITGENGRYYVCGDTQFRKGNPNIAEIVTVKEPEPIVEREDAEEAEDALTEREILEEIRHEV